MGQYLEIVLESLLADHHEPIALGQLDEGGEVDQELGTVHNLRGGFSCVHVDRVSI